jgi:hypothetical protein
MASRSLEIRLIVLKPGEVLWWLTPVAMFGSLATFVATFFAPPSPLPLLGAVGFLVACVTRMIARRTNYAPTKWPADVRIDHDGLRVGDTLVARHAEIAEGFYQPRATFQGLRKEVYGSSVRVLDRHGRIVFEAIASEEQANEILRALGLDATSRRVVFRAASPLVSTARRQALFVLVCLGLTAAGRANAIAWLPLVAWVCAALWPSRVVVGTDGVLVSWLGRRRFIPTASITRASEHGDGAIRLHGPYERSETIRVAASPVRRARAVIRRRDAVLARIREALADSRSRDSGGPLLALLARRGRSTRAWAEDVQRCAASETAYRDAGFGLDDFWRVVEDARAPNDARAAAGLALARALDDEGRARLLAVAERSASPALRHALQAVADGRGAAALETFAKTT